MNLLLVDDEPVSVQGMLEGVRWERYGITRVFSAYTAREAKAVFEREAIDLLLLDIEMPEENGITLLEWIRERDPRHRIPCVFLTCHAEFAYAQEALRLGCLDYLLKPMDYQAVEEALRKMTMSAEQSSKEQRMQRYGEQWVEEKTDAAKKYEKMPTDGEALVQETLNYICSNLSEKLSVEELAFRVHLNPDYLNRLFKKYKGVSLNKFIINERMQLAAELLKKGGITANAVARAVGYENYANFINMFKKVHGKLPSQFVNEKQQESYEN